MRQASKTRASRSSWTSRVDPWKWTVEFWSVWRPLSNTFLRNAVAHGIEDNSARSAAGKPSVGTVSISLHHQSNDVSVEFSDDGSGLNLERIRKGGQQRSGANGHGLERCRGCGFDLHARFVYGH